MKRISVGVILMLVLAACGSTPGIPSSGSSSGTPSTGPPITDSETTDPETTDPETTDPPTTDAYYTVTGQIVSRTGAPYPDAYVRFGYLVSAGEEMETHTVTDGSGTYAIELPPGQYQVTAGDLCNLNAGFEIVGEQTDDVMITVPGTSVVDFAEYPIVPGYDDEGPC